VANEVALTEASQTSTDVATMSDQVAEVDPHAPVLDLQGISRVYDSGAVAVHALEEVELRVERGEYVSVIGPSGSGKSTLLNILGLLDRPTAGTYHFEGVEVSSLTERERGAIRGHRIGFVFQAFHLLSHRTVLENVQMSMLYTGVPAKEREQRARMALEAVDLTPRTDFSPGQLSGGERQRVAIARAIVSAPAVLLADEPTGNLDSHTSDSILELFARLREAGLTIVMITHDSNVAARADRAVSIRDGRLTKVVRA